MNRRADVSALPEIEKPRIGVQTPVPWGTRACPTLPVAALSILRAPAHPMIPPDGALLVSHRFPGGPWPGPLMRARGSSWILSSEPQPLAGRTASFISIPTFPKRLAGVWFMNDKS